MINVGEGTVEEVAVPASPDPFGSQSCGGDAVSPLSQYSTCGESEFERYCSANSTMGTPSLCSTSLGPIHDFNLESESGSLKSLENFSLEAGFGRSLKLEDRKLSDSCVDWIKEKNGEDSSGIFNGFRGREESVYVGSSENNLGDVGSEGNDSGFGLGFDGREDYDAESDDGSMFGCGSGDESGKELYVNRNFKCSQNAKVENENPLLINSSVAFGSDDWDDFELESGGTLASLTLDKFQDQKQEDFASKGNISCSASLASSSPIVGCTEIGKDTIEEPAIVRPGQSDGVAGNFNDCSLLVPIGFQDAAVRQEDGARDIPVASCQVHSVHQLTNYDASNSIKPPGFPSSYELEQEDTGDASVTSNHVQGTDEATEHLKCCALNEHDPLEGKTSTGLELDIIDCSSKEKDSSVKSDKIVDIIHSKELDSRKVMVLDIEADPLADTACQSFACAAEWGNERAEIFEDKKPNSTQIKLESSISKTSSANSSVDYLKDHPAVVKAEDFELNEFYAEIVDEMEEILLDSGESRGARFHQGNHMLPSQLSLPSRDGGSTASTSGTDDPYLLVTQPLKIDGVEVVGAKQKKGDVSLSERIVGVKEYTVYILRVWSGKDSWVVERRYRDFFTLYRRLKSLFGEHGCSLPSPWYSVEKESRKLFGNVSPDVVSERSVLIQECLSSIIHSGIFSSPPGALVWFLSPQDSFPGSSSTTQGPWFAASDTRVGTEKIPVLGKTISLVVEIRPYKSTKQILEAQNYTCAGCHKHFDDGMTLMQDLVQTLGWGKPRFCEYTGQLFCLSCHTNDTAALPARVLHFWDFTQYPVSQLAKSYLDSIYEQPMLCVSAVNPMLSSKVPALQHVMSVRRRIGTLILYVRCPFRQTINKGIGHRRYLLESNDFFALRDLVDLSKGAFAALPTMLETVLGKILEHITEQCLVCCDVGIPCSAREACSDPSSLIFPFQEGDIERCTSCGSVFHKLCFGKLVSCSCGAHIGMDEDKLHLKASSQILGRRSASGLSVGLLSGLFSKSKPEIIDDHKGQDTVILMGSLPSNSL